MAKQQPNLNGIRIIGNHVVKVDGSSISAAEQNDIRSINEIGSRHSVFRQQQLEVALHKFNRGRKNKVTMEQFVSGEGMEPPLTATRMVKIEGKLTEQKVTRSELIAGEMKVAKIKAIEEEKNQAAIKKLEEIQRKRREERAKKNTNHKAPDILQYPSNLNKMMEDDFGGEYQQGFGHYILFFINQSPGPQESAQIIRENKALASKVNSKGDTRNTITNNFTASAVANTKLTNAASRFGQRPERISGRPALTQNSGGAGRPLYGDFISASKRLDTAIALYMPNQVQATYTLNYADEETGMFSTALGEVFKAMTGGKAQIEGPQLNRMAMGMAFKGLEQIAPGATNIMSVQAGRILNQKMELAFKGVGRRKFNFTFTFTPKSAQEATEIDTIIARFKMHSHPEFIPGSSGMMMTIPDTFDIQYMYNDSENSFLNRISTCFLTAISVQYGGDRFTAHTPTANHQGAEGSPPTKTVLTMEFQELETITRERVVEGY